MKNSKVLLYFGIICKLLLITFIWFDLPLFVSALMALLSLNIILYIVSNSKDLFTEKFLVRGYSLNTNSSKFRYCNDALKINTLKQLKGF